MPRRRSGATDPTRQFPESWFTDPAILAVSADARHVLVILKGLCGVLGIRVWHGMDAALVTLTGRPAPMVERAMTALIQAQLVERDDAVIWVVNGLATERQFQPTNSNHRVKLRALVDALPVLPVTARFRARYAEYLREPIQKRGMAIPMPLPMASPIPSPMASPQNRGMAYPENGGIPYPENGGIPYPENGGIPYPMPSPHAMPHAMWEGIPHGMKTEQNDEKSLPPLSARARDKGPVDGGKGDPPLRGGSLPPTPPPRLENRTEHRPQKATSQRSDVRSDVRWPVPAPIPIAQMLGVLTNPVTPTVAAQPGEPRRRSPAVDDADLASLLQTPPTPL